VPTFGVTDSDADTSGVSDLAVSTVTGNILIAEHNQNKVGVFAPDPAQGGVLVTHFDAYGAAAMDPQNIAVDPGNDALYVADASGNSAFSVARFNSDGQPNPTYTFDPSFAPSTSFSTIAGIAVDPSTHDLLVVDSGANRVVRLAASDGHELSSVEGFQGARTVAAGPSGAFYVVDAAAQSVLRYAADGTLQGALSLPSGAQPSAVTTNPVTGEVAVVVQLHGQVYIDGFAADGTPEFSVRVTEFVSLPGSGATGIAWDAGSDHIYVSTGVGQIATFVPAWQPGVDAPTATTHLNSATVAAEVAPGGGDETTARLEYCPATAACDDYPVSSPPNAFEPGYDASNPWRRGPEHEHLTTTTTIEDELPLSSNATWKVRVFARDTVTNTDNTSATATVDSPLVAPGVTTGLAGSLTDSQAELTGTIDTLGAPTTYHFEYGLTNNYGSRVPVASEAPAGDNRTPRLVSQLLQGLQSGTTYHYRLVATNSVGTAFGADRTFTTVGPDEVAPGRSYEQVTPVDKDGAQVASEAHVQIAPDGSWIAAGTASATSDAEGNRMRQNYMIRRGSDSWSDWREIDAPQNAAPGIFESSTTGVSADGNYALVVSNRILAPGGIEGGGNLYIKDLRTGGYTFVTGAPGNNTYQALANGLANEVVFAAGAPDFSWILFWGQVPLAPGAPSSALYRWSRTGGISIESRVPDTSDPSQTVDSPDVQIPEPYRLSSPTASTDGAVVGFGTTAGVFRRANGATQPLSVSRLPGDAGTLYPAYFDGMSSDGRYVFFHSLYPLTSDTPSAADLNGRYAGYRYDADTGALVFTMATAGGPGIIAIVGMATDGSTIYYDTAQGISVWRNGVVRQVTSEHPIGVMGGYYTTQNGRFFAWTSGDPTALDPQARGDLQAHLFDADTGEQACVSCLADGSPGKRAFFLLNARSIGNTVPRVVTEDGTMFFDTASPLTTSDHNGKRDVYAYRDGRLTLISPGDDTFDATFVGASDDGRDVFFQTDEPLVSQDVDEGTDVYDARIGGGFPGQSPPPASPACVRADCGELGSGSVTAPQAPSSMAAGNRANSHAISLGKVVIGSHAVRITFKASRPGRVTISGRQVVTTRRKLSKPGTYSMSVPLRREAILTRRAHKKLKVALQINLSGGWGSASVKYTRTLGK
jgi:sugar lactone lactonase YvrE